MRTKVLLHIKAGQEAFVHPEKDKLVVEAR